MTAIRNRSGQSLLLVVMIGLLFVLGITSVVTLNQISTTHQTKSAQRLTAQSLTDTGLIFITQQLSRNAGTWQNALGGNFTNTDCTGDPIDSPGGGQFKLYCSTGTANNPQLQPYQVAIRVVALDRKLGTPVRAILAYVSQRTLGADLATDAHAAAAVQLMRQPIIDGGLNVHWGPVVCLDSTKAIPWSLTETLDSQRYPRKFSAGGLTGTILRSGSVTSPADSSDLREYWARAPLKPPPVIDKSYYRDRSYEQTGITAPVSSKTSGNPALVPQNCVTSNCGYFEPDQNDAALFTGAYSNAVIYVKGSAVFDNVAIDQSTFVILGDLTVTNASGGSPLDLHVPVTAPLEYPYTPVTPTSWPCSDKAGHVVGGGFPAYDCLSGDVFPGSVHFRGFLYVAGNLTVNSTNWNMVGALLVGNVDAPPGTGGLLIIPAGNRLNVAYDDKINHAIQGTVSVQPDLIKTIPAT